MRSRASLRLVRLSSDKSKYNPEQLDRSCAEWCGCRPSSRRSSDQHMNRLLAGWQCARGAPLFGAVAHALGPLGESDRNWLVSRADIYAVPPVALRSGAILVGVQLSIHLLLVKSPAAHRTPEDISGPLRPCPRSPPYPWHSGHGRRRSHVQRTRRTQFNRIARIEHLRRHRRALHPVHTVRTMFTRIAADGVEHEIPFRRLP
jgi:hypothetical protein